MNKGPADLPPSVSYHPPFVHNLGRHRFNPNAAGVRNLNFETEILTDSEAPIATFASSETTLSLCNLITHRSNQITEKSGKSRPSAPNSTLRSKFDGMSNSLRSRGERNRREGEERETVNRWRCYSEVGEMA